MNFKTVEESNASAPSREFYKFILPQLVHSLQILKIQPKREGGCQWCFDRENVFQSVALSQCCKLRSLSVALNSTTFIQFVGFLDRNLHQLKDNFDDEVCLGDLTFQLPPYH